MGYIIIWNGWTRGDYKLATQTLGQHWTRQWTRELVIKLSLVLCVLDLRVGLYILTLKIHFLWSENIVLCIWWMNAPLGLLWERSTRYRGQCVHQKKTLNIARMGVKTARRESMHFIKVSCRFISINRNELATRQVDGQTICAVVIFSIGKVGLKSIEVILMKCMHKASHLGCVASEEIFTAYCCDSKIDHSTLFNTTRTATDHCWSGRHH